MVGFGNFLRIANLCASFYLGTMHGYLFHKDIWPNLNFLLEDQIKLIFWKSFEVCTFWKKHISNLLRPTTGQSIGKNHKSIENVPPFAPVSSGHALSTGWSIGNLLIPYLSAVAGPLKLTERKITYLNWKNSICRSRHSPEFAGITYALLSTEGEGEGTGSKVWVKNPKIPIQKIAILKQC